MNIQRDTYPTRGSESEAKPQWPLPVLDQTSSKFTNTAFVAGTDFTVPAGAANAITTIQLPYGQILGPLARVGSSGNTTFVLGGAIATTFTTEIPFVGLDGGGPDTIKLVTAGQFMIDYETGVFTGKRVDTGTTGTATYSYWLKSSVSSGGGTSNLTQVATTSVVSGTTTPSAITAGEQNVLVDTVYNTSPPSPTNGQRVNLQSDSSGNLKVTIAGQSAGSALADGTANPTTTLQGSLLEGFNGTTWDRIREGIVAPTSTTTGLLNSVGMGIYNTSAPSPTNGQAVPFQTDSYGDMQTNLYTKIAGEDLTNDVMKVQGQFTYTNITTQTTTTIKSSAGLFHRLTINTPLASGVITIFDNTAGSGTKIGTITFPATLVSDGPITATYNVKFSTGLTIVTSGSNMDITISSS